MKRFGLIFVLYQPTGDFLRNLQKARALCDYVVAIDNSPQADLPLHERLREQGMQVIYNANDGGLAGAYNKGAEVLLAQSCEVIFLFDQDSEIDETFFTKMMQACEEVGTDTFVIGPKVYAKEMGEYMWVIPPPAGKRVPKFVRIDEHTEGLLPTLFVISSGSAISRQAYRQLGAFREDYFIEYIDIEYGLRASSQGVPVYMNASVLMHQTFGEIKRHGKRFTINHVPWRRYYSARNGEDCLRLYRAHWRLYWMSGLLVLYQLCFVLLFESQKLQKIVAITCGYFDGLLGRLGRFEERHPRIAAFCKKVPRVSDASAGSSQAVIADDEENASRRPV